MSNQTAFVKPTKEGDIVRQPERGFEPLPQEGAKVPLNTFWRRRLKSGCVVKAQPKKDEAPKSEPQKFNQKREGDK